ncbi:TPA: relaxase domain-containing protein [Burkholderia vietnamiensis]|uniref:MobF family relaxase n=1 Tax=Burkholderia vietnamiensis TaxID=60552 RepID=UPI0009C14297|nr:MobF family relaxase [Burkholderia vietnamiensis]MBR8014074.1 relaxase domain-containing protein [Burkholderia vietnamiensis]HDR9040839.1 relaxase domain-containing protein [Burkholderia vietnamiensis]HDR9195839.1 relaxase domain-containing protein [Burkholderia vietnamiensis]
MVKSTPLNSKGYGKKGANILQYLKNTEYYQGSDGKMQNPTRWIGDGPEALGLSGVVDHKALDLMAAGRGPNGEPLVANAGAEHNMGYDLTFSPFKTFSVAWARANPEERERLLGAHRAAVDLSLQYLKENLDVRAGAGGTERIGCSELFAAGFTHFTNRNLDPQVHEHVLLFNVVRGADGKTRSLNTRDLQQHVYVMDQIHKGALAHSLTEMGYAVNREIELHQHTGRETGHVRYDIDGISREVVLAESSRRLELVKYAEEHNVSYNQATLATRKSKDEPAFAELDPMWSQSFAPFVESGALPSNEQLKQRPQHDLAMRDDKVLLEKLHKTEANVTRRDVVALIAAEAGPAFGHDLQKLDRMVDDFMQRNDFVQKPENSRGQVMYTSRWAIETERSLVASDQALRANTAHNLSPELVQKAVDAFEKRKTEERLQKALDDLDAAKAAVTKVSPDQQAKAAAKVAKAEAKVADARSAPPMKLTDEQRRNIDYAAMQTGGVANLVGRAGTGKTFTAQVFVDAYRAAGYEVLGVSGGWKATNKLAAEVEGLEAQALAPMLARLDAGSLKLTSKTLVVLDEAGMVGVSDRAKLERYVAEAGGKIVAAGDGRQLKSPTAGDSFRASIDVVGCSEMTDVRRQRSAEHRQTVAMLYAADNGRELFSRMQDHGHIVAVEVPDAMKDKGEDRQAIYERIARDWGESAVPERNRMVIATRNEDVRGLNDAIRAVKREKGLLTGPDVPMHIVPKASETGATVQKGFAVGDRIQFLDKHDDEAKAQKALKALRGNIIRAKQGHEVIDRMTGQAITLAELQARLPEAERKVRTAGLGVVNGTNAIIDRIEDLGNGHNRIHATILDDVQKDAKGRQQDGRRVSWSTADLNAFDHASAITNHGGQGQGEEDVFVMTSTSDENDAILVQFTREKDMVRFYGTDDDFRHFPEALEALTAKGNATDDLPAHMRTEHEQAMFERAAAKSAAERQALADTAREQLKGMGLDAATTAHDRRVDVVDAMAAEHAARVRQTPDAPPVTAAVNPRDVPALNESIRAHMRADGSLTGDDVTLTVARGGDFNPTAFRPEADARVAQNEDGDRYYRGTLVETGTGLVDPNDPTSRSPYATIRTRDGHQHQVFGVDVAPAIERGGVKPGDTIELRRTGEQPVEITDRKTGETKTVMRNGWEAAPHDFAAHEQAQREAHTAEVQRQRDAAEKPTGQAELKLAVGDVVTFGSRGAALYHGIDDAGARLTITAIDNADPANPKATACWNGQDFTLTNGDQIEHAHAVPVWKAARDAKAADAPAPFVQVMASEADRIDPQALRDVQAGAEALHVHGTGRAFKATAHAHTEHQAQREHLVERTGEAVRSINATSTVSIAEKPEAAAKELAQAWVKSDTPERERRAVGGTPHDVARLTDAIRAAKREAGQLHGEDHAVRVRAGTTSVEMPVAAGDRMVLRTDKNLSLALPVKLEEPMNATLRLNTVGRGADGVLRATATVESSNERDRKHTVTLDEDHLKRFRHGYATTQKDAVKNPRPDVFALVGERDAPARVTAALESAGQATVFTTPKAAERLAGHVETSAREAERAVQNAAKTAERATAGRDAIRTAMEKRQEQERARQQAAEAARADAQRKAAEQAKQQAEAKAKQQQAEEKKKAQERAWAKALVPQRGGGINL